MGQPISTLIEPPQTGRTILVKFAAMMPDCHRQVFEPTLTGLSSSGAGSDDVIGTFITDPRELCPGHLRLATRSKGCIPGCIPRFTPASQEQTMVAGFRSTAGQRVYAEHATRPLEPRKRVRFTPPWVQIPPSPLLIQPLTCGNVARGLFC